MAPFPVTPPSLCTHLKRLGLVSQLGFLSLLLSGKVAQASSRRALEFLAQDESAMEVEGQGQEEEEEDVDPKFVPLPAAKTQKAAAMGLGAAAAKARLLAGGRSNADHQPCALNNLMIDYAVQIAVCNLDIFVKPTLLFGGDQVERRAP